MKINGETTVEVPGIGAVRVRRMERGSTYFHPQASHRQSFAFEGVSGREFFGELVRQRVGNGRGYGVTVYLRQRLANGVCRDLPETHCQRVRMCLETYFRKAVREYAESIDAAPVDEPAPVDAFGLSPLIIDMTPTWAAIMPALIAALENGTETGKDMARKELMRLAQTVDALNSKESK